MVVDVTRQSAAKKRPFVMVVLIAAFLVGFAVWVGFDLYGSKSVRYRLTYEVEIDGQVRSGSGVVQIASQVTGEAVVVDLGDGRYLFSLLAGRPVKFSSWNSHVTSPDKLLWLAFDCGNVWYPDLFRCLNGQVSSIELPFTLLPALATIEDIDVRTTLRLVDPDDLAAHFGPGTSLKRVTIEITSDPVTEGRIEELLVWLKDWQGHVTTPEITFHRSSFIR